MTYDCGQTGGDQMDGGLPAGQHSTWTNGVSGRSDRDAGASAPAGASVASAKGTTAVSRFARELLRGRRERDRLFGRELFFDPSWDMMLDLFIAGEEGKQVPISSIGVASDIAATTALRRINTLVARGIVVREADHRDARRILLRLTEDARAKFHSFIRARMIAL